MTLFCCCCCPRSGRVLVLHNFYCFVRVGILGEINSMHVRIFQHQKKKGNAFTTGEKMTFTRHTI